MRVAEGIVCELENVLKVAPICEQISCLHFVWNVRDAKIIWAIMVSFDNVTIIRANLALALNTFGFDGHLFRSVLDSSNFAANSCQVNSRLVSILFRC